MMKMLFTFDMAAVIQAGYTLEQVYNHLKEKFAERNLVCISDDADSLIFAGTGNGNDLSRMLIMMGKLENQEWFMKIAASWLFTTDERRGWEDVLGYYKTKQSHSQGLVVV